MKPLLPEKLGSTATPRSPISEAVQTGIVTSVVTVPPLTSFRAPPFSVTSMRPSGRKAIAVGALRPVTTALSLKVDGGVPASAAGAAARNANSRVIARRFMNPGAQCYR